MYYTHICFFLATTSFGSALPSTVFGVTRGSESQKRWFCLFLQWWHVGGFPTWPAGRPPELHMEAGKIHELNGSLPRAM